jgi:hypothetical protein
MTHWGRYLTRSVSKSSEQTFFGTHFVSQKTCVTTVACWHVVLAIEFLRLRQYLGRVPATIVMQINNVAGSGTAAAAATAGRPLSQLALPGEKVGAVSIGVALTGGRRAGQAKVVRPRCQVRAVDVTIDVEISGGQKRHLAGCVELR